MHHHSTKCQKVVQIHKLLFLTYAKSEKGVHGGSPLTLRPNFNCEKGSVTAAAAACMPRRGSFVGENSQGKKGSPERGAGKPQA